MELQQEGVELQQEEVGLQQEGVELQQEGVELQQDEVGLQQEGVELQQERVELQHDEEEQLKPEDAPVDVKCIGGQNPVVTMATRYKVKIPHVWMCGLIHTYIHTCTYTHTYTHMYMCIYAVYMCLHVSLNAHVSFPRSAHSVARPTLAYLHVAGPQCLCDAKGTPIPEVDLGKVAASLATPLATPHSTSLSTQPYRIAVQLLAFGV